MFEFPFTVEPIFVPIIPTAVQLAFGNARTPQGYEVALFHVYVVFCVMWVVFSRVSSSDEFSLWVLMPCI